MPVRTSVPRGMGRDGQKNENGLEPGNPGFGDPKEFDQVWSQTVTDHSPARGEIDPDGPDLTPSEAQVSTVAQSEAEVPTLAADPAPPGGATAPVEPSRAAPLERPLMDSETDQRLSLDPVLRPDGNSDPAERASATGRLPTLARPSPGAQTASPLVESGVAGQKGSRSPGQPVQGPGLRNASPAHPMPPDPPRPSAVPLQATPTASSQGGTANIAGPGLPGSADPGVSTELSRNEVKFLSTDKQQLTGSRKGTGIGAALAGNPMRRPSENPSPSSMPSPVGSRLPTDPGVGLAVPVQLGLRQGNRLGVETDIARADSTANERIAAGSSVSESAPVSSAPSGSSNLSLAGLRQADAASVLEMVNRMADQMAARSQDRLSMTVRFENGGSIQIRMTSEQGEIRTLFQTDLPGLEAVLRQQWHQFSQEAQDRGNRLSSMAFMSTDTSPEREDSTSRNPEESEKFFDGDAPSSPGSVLETAHSPTQSNRRTSATAHRGPGQLRAWV